MSQTKEARHSKVLTVGPDIRGLGGISAVLQSYARNFPEFRYAATNSRHGSIASGLVLALLLARLPFYRLRGYNIIHAHGASGKSFIRKRIVLGLARKLGFRTIFHCHGGGFREYTVRTGTDKMRRILAGFDAVGCLSPGWAEFFRNELHCANVTVIPNIVEEPQAAAKTEPSADNLMRLIFLGKLCRDKGIYDLLEALASRHKEFEGRVELIVGGNGEVDRFNDTVKQYGLESMVRYLGWIDSETKARILSGGGVVILPSYIEGMPISLLEAGVYSMPSISTTAGAIPELIESGANGILVAPGDVRALALAISEYADNPELRCKHGREARKRITPHLPAQVGATLQTLYEPLR